MSLLDCFFALARVRMRRARAYRRIVIIVFRGIFVLKKLFCNRNGLFLRQVSRNRNNGVFGDVVLVVILFERLARYCVERLFSAENGFFKRTARIVSSGFSVFLMNAITFSSYFIS